MSVFASGSHKQPPTEDPTDVITTNNSSGAALGIATGQHQFDLGTYSWQGSVAVGNYDSESAISLGIGKRICKNCPLINGSIGIEDGKAGFGAAVNWRF